MKSIYITGLLTLGVLITACDNDHTKDPQPLTTNNTTTSPGSQNPNQPRENSYTGNQLEKSISTLENNALVYRYTNKSTIASITGVIKTNCEREFTTFMSNHKREYIDAGRQGKEYLPSVSFTGWMAGTWDTLFYQQLRAIKAQHEIRKEENGIINILFSDATIAYTNTGCLALTDYIKSDASGVPIPGPNDCGVITTSSINTLYSTLKSTVYPKIRTWKYTNDLGFTAIMDSVERKYATGNTSILKTFVNTEKTNFSSNGLKKCKYQPVNSSNELNAFWSSYTTELETLKSNFKNDTQSFDTLWSTVELNMKEDLLAEIRAWMEVDTNNVKNARLEAD